MFWCETIVVVFPHYLIIYIKDYSKACYLMTVTVYNIKKQFVMFQPFYCLTMVIENWVAADVFLLSILISNAYRQLNMSECRSLEANDVDIILRLQS